MNGEKHGRDSSDPGKSAGKSAGSLGRPFLPGPDPRRGCGPKKGAPSAGRPTNALRAQLHEAGLQVALPRLAQVAAEGKDADAVRAAAVILNKALPRHSEPEVAGPGFVVVLPPRAQTTAEWLAMVKRGND